MITMAFSGDGRSLFSGGGDSTILRWDVTGRHGKTHAKPKLAAAWESLAGNAPDAYRARWDLLDVPEDFIAFLREHLPAAKAPDAQQFRKLVDSLDSPNFRLRNQATIEIKAFGCAAEALLRKYIRNEKRLEVRRRLEAIHDGLLKTPSWQRARRALGVVAAMPPSVARGYIQDLANGDAEAVLTQEAKALLTRWQGRAKQR